MKIIYEGEPKDKNIETEQMIYRHTERVDHKRLGRNKIKMKKYDPNLTMLPHV